MVIIDSSIWIQAYRLPNSIERAEVARLVAEQDAAIVGVVFAEIMRGARDETEFDQLREELLAAEFIEDSFEDWLGASRILFDLKRQGQVIPLQDALIAAQAIQGEHRIYTKDEHFQRILGLQLYEARNA